LTSAKSHRIINRAILINYSSNVLFSAGGVLL